MDARGRGLLSLYIYIENFKNVLTRNHWTDSNITWQEGFLGDTLPRLFKKGKRKVQGVPQSQTAALPRPQEEEETDKSKQAQTKQTYEKH